MSCTEARIPQTHSSDGIWIISSRERGHDDPQVAALAARRRRSCRHRRRCAGRIPARQRRGSPAAQDAGAGAAVDRPAPRACPLRNPGTVLRARSSRAPQDRCRRGLVQHRLARTADRSAHRAGLSRRPGQRPHPGDGPAGRTQRRPPRQRGVVLQLQGQHGLPRPAPGHAAGRRRPHDAARTSRPPRTSSPRCFWPRSNRART